jgi:hypothetical protein
MERYCLIQIDVDDNQWVIPRQQNQPYDINRSDIFSKAVDNIRRYLSPYPLTLFLVGFDMKVEEKVSKIKELIGVCRNIEIANHSLSHFNNFNCLSKDEKKKEIVDSDRLIKGALSLPHLYGYRNPGYIFNADIIRLLKDNGYMYDASLFPSYFGPILRNINYLVNNVKGKDNFGYFKNGFLPNEPVLLDEERGFFEINVSVCPILRIPIHYSIIRSKKIYSILSYFINKIKYLNFVFHLYDFVNVDIIRLRYVLNMITSERLAILGRDIIRYYKSFSKKII